MFYLSHFGFQFCIGVAAKMSSDSMVSSLPSGQWSCESLEAGIRAAAQKCGLELQPSQLDQAWWLGRHKYILEKISMLVLNHFGFDGMDA